MFGEVPTAVARLALCVRTQRRIGATHALLHLRRLAAACLRRNIANDSALGTRARRIAMTLAQPLKEIDDALAADRLTPAAITITMSKLSFVRFQLWYLQRSSGMAFAMEPTPLCEEPDDEKTKTYFPARARDAGL
jgi:hypothetical protein